MENTAKKPRGKRGQGCVYRPKGSRNWWIKFSVAGRIVQESANTESRREALDTLKGKILKYTNGEAVDCRNTTVESLKESMLAAWKLHGRGPHSIKWAKGCWKHLLAFFGNAKANSVSSQSVRDYMEKRKAQGASNASVNRELSILQRAFALGFEETPRRVTAKLYFERLPESKPRQGFIEEKTYRALAENCEGLYLRAMLALAYSFGFRKGELLNLKVGNVDLLARAVRLETSKNGEPRQVNLTDETRKLLSACVAGKAPAAFVSDSKEVVGEALARGCCSFCGCGCGCGFARAGPLAWLLAWPCLPHRFSAPRRPELDSLSRMPACFTSSMSARALW